MCANFGEKEDDRIDRGMRNLNSQFNIFILTFEN